MSRRPEPSTTTPNLSTTLNLTPGTTHHQPLPEPLTGAHVQLVRSHLSASTPLLAPFAEHFLRALARRVPSLKAQLPDPALRGTQRHVAYHVAMLTRYLGTDRSLAHAQDLGRLLNLTPEQSDVREPLRQAFLEAWSTQTPETWTPALSQAWSSTIENVAQAMGLSQQQTQDATTREQNTGHKPSRLAA
jgi:hypothetical protein